MPRRRRSGLDCRSAIALIEAHLDGSPSAPPSAELAAHLERCASCRAELELAETIARETSRLPQFDTPNRVIEAARRRIAGPEAPPRAAEPSRRRPPAWAALAAAALAAIAITAVLTGPERPPEPSRASDAEVARATAEARLAFALIADATERAEHELRDSVLRDRVLATAVRGVSRSFRLRSTLSQAPDLGPTPTTPPGGST